MAESKKLFSLELERIREVWDQQNWSDLQHIFRTEGVHLSNSLIAWRERSGTEWLLADFENKKTYDIKMVNVADGSPSVEVWERSSDEEKLLTSKDTEFILSRLQGAQGTNRGFIDLVTRLDLEELDLERLKRADLSGAGFSFEFQQENLLVIHEMFRDILTSSRESLLNMSWGELMIISQILQQFYATVQEIEGFKISDQNPREEHVNLLRKITELCDSAPQSLRYLTAYLNSKKANLFEAQVNTRVNDTVARLDAETERAKQNNEEAERQKAEMQQEFDQLKLEVQNQLVEKPISQYKTIFSEQAQEHKKNSRFWLGMAGVATGALAAAFILLTIFVKFEGTALTGTLQNLFTKGFLLSPIFVWLNRSIKNHTAQKHLEVINTHRQNALETFDTFVAAAEGNRETRDAVLLAATDAIFDANQTGYLSTKATGPDSRSPAQQIIREIIPQKSSSKDG